MTDPAPPAHGVPPAPTERLPEAGPFPWGTLLLLVFAAAAIRCYLAWRTPVLGTDAAPYLWTAAEFDQQGWKAESAFRYEPVYIVLIACVSHVVGGYERAGLLISIVLGSLALLPVFFLSRRLAGRQVALFACALLATQTHAARLGSDVMTEATYFFWFALALSFGAIAVLDRRVWAALAAGVAVGLACLTREEGALLGAILGGWLLFADPGSWRKTPLRAALLPLLLGVGFLATVAPYLLLQGRMQGQAKVVFTSAQPTPPDGKTGPVATTEEVKDDSRITRYSSRFGRPLGCIVYFVVKFPKTIKLHLLPLLLVPLFASRVPRARRGDLLVASVVLAYAALFYWHLYRTSLSSHRYLLTLIVTMLPWMGVGAYGACLWIQKRWPARGRHFAAGACVLFLVPVLVETLKIQRKDQVGYREAGEWIRDHGEPSPLVMSTTEKVAYYSGNRHFYWPWMPYTAWREIAPADLRYAADTEENIRIMAPDFPIEGRPGEIELVHRSAAHDDAGPVLVYRIVRP